MTVETIEDDLERGIAPGGTCGDARWCNPNRRSHAPLSLRRQRWSPLNVPLMWSAAGRKCPHRCSSGWWVQQESSQNRFSFTEAKFQRGACGVVVIARCHEKLAHQHPSTWLRSQGSSRPGHHIPARAQEQIPSEACREDARVALLEAIWGVSAVMADFGQNRLWPKQTWAKTDLGQNRLGPNRLGPNRLWPKPTLAKPTWAKPILICMYTKNNKKIQTINTKNPNN